MLAPARRNLARQASARTVSLPAPVLGWNRRDSIATMKPGFSIVTRNMFPTASDVMLRKGWTAHATDIDDGGTDLRVETLVVYRPPSGSHKMFAFADEFLFDVTGVGAVGAATVSGLTNAQWQYDNFSTSGGNFILAVNGADELLLYNGTTWASIDGSSTPAITGVATTALINVNVFKQRPYYVQVGTMSVWYPSAAGTFSGALTEFPLRSVFKRGGYLIAMGNWTLDGGAGLDDLAVFVTSEGEVAVYAGTGPADFALAGTYNIGAPIGRRCMKKYGGDLLIITNDGVIPASKAFAADRTSKAVAITDNIQGAMSDAAALYKGNSGWSLTQFPAGSMLILNVPVAVEQQQQYVMNSVTGAWCPFTGWGASCFEVFNDELYYGTLGEVRKAWSGTSDGGAIIEGELVPAFHYFGSRSKLKQWPMLRPVISVDANPQEILAGLDVDYLVQTPSGSINFPTVGGALWDTAEWDVDVWGGAALVQGRWYAVTGVGYSAAAHMVFRSNRSNLRVLSFDYIVKDGGFL